MRQLFRTYLPCLLVFGLFVFYPGLLSAQFSKAGLPDSLVNYAENIFGTIQSRSIYTSRVDLDRIKSEFYAGVGDAKNRRELASRFSEVFVALGDFHGGLYFNEYRYGIQPKSVEVSTDLSTGWKHGPMIRTRIFQGKYAYLFMPAFASRSLAERNGLAQQVQDSICTCNQRGVEGWIIDLRLNNGGDMWAMLGGLSDLLGTRTLGIFLMPDGQQLRWEIKDGNLFEGEKQKTNLRSRCNVREPIRIAALVSPVTSSSAEAVAISLQALPKSVLIGEKTSGYTTATEFYVIDKQTSVLLSGAYMADGTGKYSEFVIPDIQVINGDNFDTLEIDKKILAAIKWFDTNSLKK